jgi:hypothetical protein
MAGIRPAIPTTTFGNKEEIIDVLVFDACYLFLIGKPAFSYVNYDSTAWELGWASFGFDRNLAEKESMESRNDNINFYFLFVNP